MEDSSLGRRKFLAATGVAVSGTVGGCSSVTRFVRDASVESTLSGTVRGGDGEYISGATVELVAPSAGVDRSALTDADGQFRIETPERGWVTVTHEDYNTRVRAAEPAGVSEIRLSDDRAVSMAFGGDVMFGRRYYESNGDDGRPRFRLDEDDQLESHRKLLADIAPLFSAADIGSVNLETPLTTSPWRHPSKLFSFVSHPVASQALRDAGIDYTALGNNHTFDALIPGMRETLASLEGSDIAHSGAGFSSEDAWEPALLETGEFTVAFVSCTTISGGSHSIDWSADRNPERQHTVSAADVSTVPDDSDPLRFSGSTGVAEASQGRLGEVVNSADSTADIVVLQIHGGDEYVREPTDRIERLVDEGIDAGADLVVNHHPHVTGGIERRNGALVAWTLGNLVFEQELWETLDSYVLTVDIDDNGVVRASTEPVVIQGYVPRLATGRTRKQLATRTAELVDEPLGLTADGITTVGSDRRVQSQTVTGDGSIYAVTEGWINGVQTEEADALVGYDRFRFGHFQNDLVTADPVAGPLWRFGRDSATTGAELGPGVGGIELERQAMNNSRVFLSPRHRIPIDDQPLTLTGWYRFDGSGEFQIFVSWYDDTAGNSFQQMEFTPSGTNGEWERVRYDLSPPESATFADIFIYLTPPADGERRVRLSDLRLIEWAETSRSGPSFDHLFLDGEAIVELGRYQRLSGVPAIEALSTR